MPPRDTRYYLLQPSSALVEVPRLGLDWSFTRTYSRNVRVERAPGNPEGFLVGDAEWEPFVFTLSFTVRGDGTSAGDRAGDAEADINLLITRADAATSVIREVDTTPLTTGSNAVITDGAGDPIFASVGNAVAVAEFLTPSITPVNLAGDYRMSLGWLTKFGLPTTVIAETRSAYDAATKTY